MEKQIWTTLLILTCIFIILLLAFSLFTLLRQLRSINHQIMEKRKIRVSLSNRHIEELAALINEKDAQHKALQIQIMQEEERLKQSVSNISHDLRTPLTSMQGYLTLLQECGEKEKQQYIQIIQAKTDYLTELVQDFYDLSVIENGELDFEMEKVDINRIVTDCLIEKYREFGEMEPMIQIEDAPIWIQGNTLACKRIIENLDINRIVTDCLIEKYREFGEMEPMIQIEDAPIWIQGNTLACKRIIENLLTNAIRYSDFEIEISLDKSGVFTVKNTASMLRQEDMEFLFCKFYTADHSRTRGGSGLGLYIVKELLEKINGRIETAEYTAPTLTIAIRFALYECHSRTRGGSGLGLYIVKELLEKINGRIETAEYTAPTLTIAIRFALYECAEKISIL